MKFVLSVRLSAVRLLLGAIHLAAWCSNFSGRVESIVRLEDGEREYDGCRSCRAVEVMGFESLDFCIGVCELGIGVFRDNNPKLHAGQARSCVTGAEIYYTLIKLSAGRPGPRE